jgi:hypothetical protein
MPMIVIVVAKSKQKDEDLGEEKIRNSNVTRHLGARIIMCIIVDLNLGDLLHVWR